MHSHARAHTHTRARSRARQVLIPARSPAGRSARPLTGQFSPAYAPNQRHPPTRQESSPAAASRAQSGSQHLFAAPSAITSSPAPFPMEPPFPLQTPRSPQNTPLGPLQRRLPPRAPVSSQSPFPPGKPCPKHPSRTPSGPDPPTSRAVRNRPGPARRPPAAERRKLPGATAASSARQFRVCTGGRVPLGAGEGGGG